MPRNINEYKKYLEEIIARLEMMKQECEAHKAELADLKKEIGEWYVYFNLKFHSCVEWTNYWC